MVANKGDHCILVIMNFEMQSCHGLRLVVQCYGLFWSVTCPTHIFRAIQR